MNTIAYLDCFSGISGDMTLAALLDLGVPESYIIDNLARLPVQGYSLRISRQRRGGVEGTRIEVEVDRTQQVHRTYGQIRSMLESAGFPEKVVSLATRIFGLLAEAESRIHGVPVDEVHFHELGAVDSIVDIVGTALAVDYLLIDRAYVSQLPLAGGFVRCEHGTLPLPAPATLEIVRGMRVRITSLEGEFVTPTGAAIAASLAGESHPTVPPLKVTRIGYGLGMREYQHPNLLRIILGEAVTVYEEDEVIELECHIDDLNPELYEHVMERLFAHGALDVTLTPLHMKKGRPGILLRVLADSAARGAVIEVLFSETTTIGIRIHTVQRVKLTRRQEIAETPYGKVRVKVVHVDGLPHDEWRPEYEDCKRIALREGIPLRKVYEMVTSIVSSSCPKRGRSL